MSIDLRYIALYDLQQYFVDKTTGDPLSSGVVTFYKDEDRTVKKDIFEITGSGGNYSFVALPNPLTLSSVGTPIDDSNNDIVIYVYPYNEQGEAELYYVTITSSVDTGLIPQFTREALPSGIVDITPPGPSTLDQLSNLIINGSFYFNIGITGTISDSVNTLLAPGASASSINGLIDPDIRLVKSSVVATDSITFNNFSPGDIPVENVVTPEFYLTYTCSSIPTLETFKAIQFPISSVNELNSISVTISFCARSTNSNSLFLYSYQNFGTGGSSPAQNLLQSFQLTSSFQKYTAFVTIPSTTGKTISALQDDFIALWVGLDLNCLNTTDIYNVQIIIGNQEETSYIYTAPSEVAAQVFSPRTGDIRVSLRAQDASWLPMNDGTIGDSSSNATTRAYNDTFALYNLIWNQIVGTTPTSIQYSPLYTSTGLLTTAGASASEDYNAHKQLSLTKTLGRVLAGANPAINSSILQTISSVSTNNLIVTSTSTNYTGQPLIIKSVGGLVPDPLVGDYYTYYAIVINGTNLQLAYTYDDALSGNEINLTDVGSGTLSIGTVIYGTPVYSAQFTANTTTDTLTVADASSLLDGDSVQVRALSGGTLPSPLTETAIYFVIPISATTIQLAETRLDAYANTPIDITTIGTSPNILYVPSMASVLGQFYGEEGHSQTNSELSRHAHAYTGFKNNEGESGTNTGGAAQGNTTSFAGRNKEFNLIQPTTYMNIYIKL